MLNSIIQNLISNAIKYSYENSVIILSMIANEEFIAVSVADSGVGIPEKILPRLFKPDSIHTTRGTNNEIGTGFGLLLCKEMVERNGGSIWVESIHKKGSTFKFTVPRIKT
jgi:signal transduction histidine kinase